MVERLRLGGIAALAAAGTFIFGFALFASVLSDLANGDLSPATSVAFVAGHETALVVWNVVIFIVFGMLLVPAALGLHERLRSGAPTISRTALAFGLLWAGIVVAAGMVATVGVGTVADLHASDPTLAVPVWSSLDAVQNGLGGGIEILGATWVLLISFAATRTRALPVGTNLLGFLAGVAGAATVVPAFEDLGALFGVAMIVWFAWAGIVLLRSARSRTRASATVGVRELAEVPR